MQSRRHGDLLTILTACCVVLLIPAQVSSTELSEADIKEIRRIEAALADGLLPQPPGWTFNHAASEEGQQELERLGYPNRDENLEAVVRKAGGWAEYKANAAALLKSNDPVVRGFMAIWVADLGDPAYVPQLWELLKTKQPVQIQYIPEDWDRGLAASA
ncbi:MAG: hypothetical protein AB7P12_10555, partial [Alphaproteobacteria bacterium]